MLRRKQNLSDALVDDIRNKEEAARDAKAFETSRSVAASRKRAEALLDEIADEIPRVVQHCAENGPEPHVFTVIVVKDSVFGSKIRRVEKAGWTVLSYTQTDLAPKYESSANLQRQWKITADGWLVYPGQGRMTKKKFASMPDYELPLAGVGERAFETVLQSLRQMRSTATE